MKAAGGSQYQTLFRKLSAENADERLGDLMGIICCARASKGSAAVAFHNSRLGDSNINSFMKLKKLLGKIENII